ncbi:MULTISPECIES: hypothetical protein [Pseudomonas fluorescens group]|uniref:Phage-related protein n=2 Tax=Pseudomonas fluorescens TaxID=294 RepID=C3KA72_PSEFS|nr:MULTISPECIES: hypothetical protein [Pseudomonas fluorescens group]WQD75094.1 hypothetical protein U0037_14465 [Pseudomonas marginalis]CAI2797118.1 Putative phage-related protein [Pseudomonas fluorescens SBW25]
MTWYKTGTVSVTPGSNAVLGAGTSFIANSRVGDAFRGPDGEWYEVTNIASDSALSIAPAYQGSAVATGVYSLAPMQGYVKDSADALRAATQVIASGVADMQEQVEVATEAATSAGQSKTVATEQAGIATAAASLSTDNKDAAQLAAQQSASSSQASGAAANLAETAKNSSVQSQQAAASSAAAAAASAAHAEEVTVGKAASGDNNDITSLRAISADGFDRIRLGIAQMAGATAGVGGVKGLVPAPSIADRLKVLSGAGTWVVLPSPSWGNISGSLSAQTDLQTALDNKIESGLVQFSYLYPNGGSAASPASVTINQRYVNSNPFPGHPVICQAELLVNGVWGDAGWMFATASNIQGTRASQYGDDIVVATGVSFLANISQSSGGGFPTSPQNSTYPCRVRVWRIKA